MPDGLTTPDVRSTVAILRSLLLHVPPADSSLKDTEVPATHIVGFPDITLGPGFTVAVIVVLQPTPAPLV